MEQKIKIISYRGRDGADAPDLKPFVSSEIARIRSDLSGLIASYSDSQGLANNLFDSNIKEIENKVSELISLIDTKVSSSDLINFQSDVISFIKNINNSLATLVTKAELEKIIKALDYLTSDSIIDGGVII